MSGARNIESRIASNYRLRRNHADQGYASIAHGLASCSHIHTSYVTYDYGGEVVKAQGGFLYGPHSNGLLAFMLPEVAYENNCALMCAGR